mmetsp:Transcript_8056/g.17005  ORF Transcript_8056/g.17005 Transcript_8056/m.17005 type:complete len:295 (+) Transcript_8056:67-951(+)
MVVFVVLPQDGLGLSHNAGKETIGPRLLFQERPVLVRIIVKGGQFQHDANQGSTSFLLFGGIGRKGGRVRGQIVFQAHELECRSSPVGVVIRQWLIKGFQTVEQLVFFLSRQDATLRFKRDLLTGAVGLLEHSHHLRCCLVLVVVVTVVVAAAHHHHPDPLCRILFLESSIIFGRVKEWFEIIAVVVVVRIGWFEFPTLDLISKPDYRGPVRQGNFFFFFDFFHGQSTAGINGSCGRVIGHGGGVRVIDNDHSVVATAENGTIFQLGLLLLLLLHAAVRMSSFQGILAVVLVGG